MTTVGKLLVVAQLVLSLSFVVFAGAVYSTHKSWRGKAEQLEQQVSKARADMNAAQDELNAKQAEATAAVEKAQGEVVQLQGQLQNAENALQAAQAKNNDLEAQLLAQTGLAEAKAAEAIARKEQADVQRVVNNELHDRLDQTSAKARSLNDEVFARGLALEQLESRYSTTLSELADMKTVLAATGVSTDIEALRAQGEPPPPIDGLITDTRRDKTGSVRYVSISIGSDDGIDKGDELDVFRPAELNDGRGKYLGKIRVVMLNNDTAVGRVVEHTGIIEEGDNVTSKL